LYDGIEDQQEALELETQFMIDFDSVENGCNDRFSVHNHQMWYELNRDKLLEQNKQYYNENRDRLLEQKKQYYIENKDKILERMNQYHIENREKILKYQKQKVKCENCESIINRRKMTRHQRSQKCINKQK
jgi:hypothetical protein